MDELHCSYIAEARERGLLYLGLLRHAGPLTVPGIPVSPFRSGATVMNYANPLVLSGAR